MENVIYKISNSINDKIYIGSAKKFNYRKNVHLSYLRKGNHHSRKLQNHVNKYGVDSLIFEIIEECSSVDVLIEREQFYLDTLKPFFNIRKKAESQLGVVWSKESKDKLVKSRQKYYDEIRGKKRSPDICKKISEGKKKSNYRHSEETKIKIGNSSRGRRHSEESLRKISEASKGREMSIETRKKISERQKTSRNYMKGRSGNLHHNYGKKLSEDKIQKMRNRGRKIIDLETGIIYNNISDIIEKTKIPRGTMGRYLSGLVKSVKRYKYYEKEV